MAQRSPRLKSLADGVAVTPSIRLVRQLGRGGMGSIWIAEHEGLRTRVVVKFMDPKLAADPESVGRFSREAAAAASVRSPHVVQIFDHGVTERGLPFIVMELLEGQDLGDHLAEIGRMKLRAVSNLVTQTAKALTRAHSFGIVHRDIKPENIFLCDVGVGDIFVKLLDFGLAKSSEQELTSETRTGATMGTPFYMSPEQIVTPKHADPRSDLWALAVVAFECVTGFRPFEGETVGAIAVALHSGTKPRATNHVKNLPPALDDWFERAFATEIEKRFPDAASMAAAFRAIAIAAPVHIEESSEKVITGRRKKVDLFPDIDPTAPPPAEGDSAQFTKAPVDTGRRRPWKLYGALGAGLVLLGIGTCVALRKDEPPREAAKAPQQTQAVAVAPVATPEPQPSAHAPAALVPEPAPSVTIAKATASAPKPSASPKEPSTVKPSVSAAVKKKYVDIK